MDYQEFLASKRLIFKSAGKKVDVSEVNPLLFPFQRDLVTWGVRKGRAALFADTGLGKTLMQLEWARLVGERTLILAPLSVARQTVNEGKKIGLDVRYVREQSQVTDETKLYITNYEMIAHFDPGYFGAIVLDESSILKSIEGKTRQKLTEMFTNTLYRLACTATPAPNDIQEIANHAEFLGVMSRAEMLSAFFVHDDEGWRLKSHAQENFFRWMASWGMSIRKPSDLGYANDGYVLPSLNITPVFVDSDYRPDGQLFFTGLHGITDRAAVRKATIDEKASLCAGLVNASDEQWIVWHGLNSEGDMLLKLIPGAVLVKGSQPMDAKIAAIEAFQDGKTRVLITKPKIAGFGINFQNSHNMAFVGLNDSFEAFYQAIRRQWRFGQTQPVNVHIILSEIEQEIYQNVRQKEAEAERMSVRLIENIQEFERDEILKGDLGTFDYQTGEDSGQSWRLMLGDSAERMADLPDNSVDLSVFSPPFQSLYTYSPTERDLGNSSSKEEFFAHFGFIIEQLLRVTKPGRNAAVHVQQLTTTKATDGYIGMKDFRGDVIRAFESHGWHYYGEVCIDKDPQAQAIRTHSKGLLFTQFHKDSAWSRPALADYIIVFKKPGDNEAPVIPDMTNDEWIEWARPIWYGIKESDTLNVRAARTVEDERHICPLQLGTIERVVRLWSNRGETVFSPFAGIGSEGFEAIRHGRKFIGIELKPEYFKQAVKNLKEADLQSGSMDLFKWAEQQTSIDTSAEREKAEESAKIA